MARSSDYGKAGIVSFYDDVIQFHYRQGVPVATSAQLPPIKRQKLRTTLLKEEYLELCNAIDSANDLAHIAKELADLVYVVLGTAAEYGIPFNEVWDAVHASNLSKDGDTRNDGKILKGEKYQPPNIYLVIKAAANVEQ